MDTAILEELSTFPAQHFSKGDTIICQGTPSKCVLYLESGRAVRTAVTLKGDEILYDERQADGSAQCLLGALTLYTANKMHETSFVAKTPCLCRVIDNRTFIDFLTRNPQVLHELMFMAMDRYSFLDANFQAKQKGMAPARVAAWFLDHSQRQGADLCYDSDLNISELARYLGMHRVTVSKIVTALADNACIAFSDKQVLIKDLPALEAIAGGLIQLHY
jgi:CRP-like cAMP-binding protein